MKESVTYQAILAEGRGEGLAKGRTEGLLEEAKLLLLRLGRKSLGEPDAVSRAVIGAMTNLRDVEVFVERVHDKASWQELLGSVKPSRPGRKARQINESDFTRCDATSGMEQDCLPDLIPQLVCHAWVSRARSVSDWFPPKHCRIPHD